MKMGRFGFIGCFVVLLLAARLAGAAPASDAAGIGLEKEITVALDREGRIPVHAAPASANSTP